MGPSGLPEGDSVFLPAAEIREQFLRYFEERGHRRVPSASLVPDSDPTLMFVNAGMVPFKRVFLGEEDRGYKRAVSSQKCMRVSGKHNDLDEVGRSKRHHTFFEMLGNFSFGDYFKEEALEYAWELLTVGYGLSPDELAVSVFREDDEAFAIWRDRLGLPESKIFRLDEDENFWSMGETGPCGPCSEIHMDYGVQAGCTAEVCDPSCECGRWLEIWNNVFMQLDRSASGEKTPLPKPSIDTGMGLDRLAQVLQRVETNYDTDTFQKIIARACELSGVEYGAEEDSTVSLKIVADHARALTFLIGDGVLPSNEGRGYVLRRILRRASRQGALLGVEGPFVHGVADAVIDEMSGAYPELEERRAFITDRIRRDEERFLETLSKGLQVLEGEIAEAKGRGDAVLQGETVFRLYDTYGFPVDLTEDILASHDMRADEAGFRSAMDAQRARARAAWKGSGDAAVDEVYGRIAADVDVRFVGYDRLQAQSSIRALLRDGEPVPGADAGDRVEIVVAETPFYGESGGQVGDRGTLATESGLVRVEDTVKPVDGLFVHRGVVEDGHVDEHAEARLEVDADLRQATVRNHTGTHLLHAALREVLGPQAMQKGSLVGPDRLRFDFTHDAPLSEDEIFRIEDLANEWIEANEPAAVRHSSFQEAVEAGAVAIFEEKYGDEVRVVSFGPVSTELCGGTHARATGEIGLLKIVSETGIAAGVRRIEALTGMGALRYIRERDRLAREAAGLLKGTVDELPTRVEKLMDERRAALRQVEEARRSARGDSAGDLVAGAVEVDGARMLAARVEDVDAGELRTLVDDLKNRLGSGAVCLAGESGGKVLLAVGVTKDLTARFRAGDLISDVAKVVGGGGGGRPDFAQAGGKDASRIDDALARFRELVGAG